MSRIRLLVEGAIVATIILLTAAVLLGPGLSGGRPTVQLERIKLPPGFSIAVYADNVPNAREMALSDKGTLFVGSRKAGKVYAVLDRNKDHKADEVLVIASGLTQPNGVALHDGDLYVAEISRVLRFDDIEDHLDNPPKPVVVNDSFPKDEHHGWKFIAFGPDGWLYVPVGAPCNVCLRDDPRYASLMRMKPDGSQLEVFASGIRNTVGFDWNPQTGVLWFTDNGRDWMGDNRPPDELNRAPEKGMHFGFPFMHGVDIRDPEFWARRPDRPLTPAAQPLGPHVAALGMTFYAGKGFPEPYHNQIFIAEHGSWNRSVPIGYRVMLVKLNDKHEPISYEPFATGWLAGREAWGRPVDVQVDADGGLLVSDDHAGVIYRISYDKPGR